MSRRTKRKIVVTVLVILGAVLGLLIVVSSVAVPILKNTASDVKADPAVEEQVFEDGFPRVDWLYWQGINPDVIGWITVPGTTIDYPIVQAQTSDPQWYLWHDVFGNWNPYGAIYLDAACVEAGLSSKNAIIYGHNMGYGDRSMFADLCLMTNTDFPFTEAPILLQTPTEKKRKDPGFVSIISGSQPYKHTLFETDAEYLYWYEAHRSGALIVVKRDDTPPDSICTLVTCSYFRFDDERTLVCAS